MRSLKKEIFLTLLFITIGIAAVTTNVIVNMSTTINKNPDDFLVYFSDVEVNGTQDLSLVENSQKLVFNGEFTAVGDKKIISYDVTNASSNYDADILINCTSSTRYLNITNEFDMKNSLSARSTKTGTLTIELSTAVSEEVNQEVTCTIEANAVERDSQASGEVGELITGQKKFDYVDSDNSGDVSYGDVYYLDSEVFNVIDQTDDAIVVLAKKNISDVEPYIQTDVQGQVLYSGGRDWITVPGVIEVDLQLWGGDAETILNGYLSYLNTEFGVSANGDFITLSKLHNLGCNVPTDYLYGDGGWTCATSPYSEWLVNGQAWWTKSAWIEEPDYLYLWGVDDDGGSDDKCYGDSRGVRPVITVSKNYLKSN